MALVMSIYKPGIDPNARLAFQTGEEYQVGIRREETSYNPCENCPSRNTLSQCTDCPHVTREHEIDEDSHVHISRAAATEMTMGGTIQKIDIITAKCPHCQRIKPVTTSHFNYVVTPDAEGFDRVCKVCRCIEETKTALSEAMMDQQLSDAQKAVLNAINKVDIEDMYARRVEPAPGNMKYPRGRQRRR